MSLDELRMLVQSGELKEDVFKELVRINSASDNSNNNNHDDSHNNNAPSITKVARPLSRAATPETLVVVVNEGWLFVRKKGKDSWKRRYVGLSYTSLEWHNSNDVKARKLKGSAQLSGDLSVQRLEDDVLAFGLFRNGVNALDVEFSADSEADVKRWLSEISRIVTLLRGADGKDLPVLLNRPMRSESQVARDYLAREHNAKKMAEKSMVMTTMQEQDVENNEDNDDERKPSAERRTVEEEKEDHPDDHSSQSEPEDEKDPIVSPPQRISVEEANNLKEAAQREIDEKENERTQKVAALNALKDRYVELHDQEMNFTNQLYSARTIESTAFEDLNRARREAKVSAERITVLESQEREAIKALEAFKAQHPNAGSQSSSGRPAHSSALQRLLMKDGVKVDVDPISQRFSELNLKVQSARKSLHSERDKLARAEAERSRAESSLRAARSTVAEAIRRQQDVVKAKRAIQTQILEEERVIDVITTRIQTLRDALDSLN